MSTTRHHRMSLLPRNYWLAWERPLQWPPSRLESPPPGALPLAGDTHMATWHSQLSPFFCTPNLFAFLFFLHSYFFCIPFFEHSLLLDTKQSELGQYQLKSTAMCSSLYPSKRLGSSLRDGCEQTGVRWGNCPEPPWMEPWQKSLVWSIRGTPHGRTSLSWLHPWLRTTRGSFIP